MEDFMENKSFWFLILALPQESGPYNQMPDDMIVFPTKYRVISEIVFLFSVLGTLHK